MTALSEYQRLESTGVWRASPQAQRRDVIVSVGDATLTLFDMADRPLGHWSLPAVERLNPGVIPALFSPAPDAEEDLELDDPEMIAAIERVRTAVARRQPRPGRLRLAMLGGGLAAVLGLAVFWLPDALVRHAASVVPPVTRTALGERLLAEVQRVSGSPCRSPRGQAALARLQHRLLPDDEVRLAVLAGGGQPSQHLPGGLILLGRSLVEDHEDPAVAAGYVLAEAARAAERDPVERLLDDAGPFTAFRLLTTGRVPDATLARHAETLMAEAPVPVPDTTLLKQFGAAGVPSTPYAYALDISGETTLGLIEADPVAPGARTPILPDGDWVALQGICGG